MSQGGVVTGNINITSTIRGMYVEIFVYNGGLYYWISDNGNYVE